MHDNNPDSLSVWHISLEKNKCQLSGCFIHLRTETSQYYSIFIIFIIYG